MNKVKYYRLISGLLLKDLSEKTGLSVGHLSHIENGNKQPSKSAMESIALAVGSTVPEVFNAYAIRFNGLSGKGPATNLRTYP